MSIGPRTLHERWRRAVRGLEGGLRASYLGHEVSVHPLANVADALDQLCAAAERSEPDARELLISLVDLLAMPGSAELAQALREEAAGRSLLSLARVLRRPLPRPSHPPESSSIAPPPSRIPDYGAGRPLTLGERRSLARRPSRKSFEKLFADPHPMVIRMLLANPKVTEDDVVRLAARRPMAADILAEIVKSPRWVHRVRVRMAIVLHPDCPTELSIPLVGLLVRSELAQVQASPDLPPIVRATAGEFLARKPPLREPPDDAPLQ